jgi:nucleotide-binding universal stress UspA family protein
VLAVLECRGSDDAVRTRAVEVAERSGGYLTLVCIAPRPGPWLNAGPYCTPRVSPDELRANASATLSRAAALVPSDVPLLTAIDEGRPASVIRRRVEVAAHDLVVVRTRRRRSGRRILPAHLLTCDRKGDACSSPT